MSVTLYELTDEYLAILREADIWAEEHEGDLSEFPLNERLQEVGGSREDKVLNIAVFIKNLKAEAAAHGAEAKAQAAKEKALLNKAERLRVWIERNTTHAEKFKDHRAQVRWQANPPSVILDAEFEADPRKLPERFQRLSVEVNKAALKEAAVEVDGRAVVKDGEREIAQVVKTQGLRIS